MKAVKRYSFFILFLIGIFFQVSCLSGRFDRLVKSADMLRGEKKYDEAAYAYKTIILKYPDDRRTALVIIKLAALYESTLDNKSVPLDLYNSVIHKWPLEALSAEAYKRKGLLLMEQQKYDEAIETFSMATKYFSEYNEWFLFQQQIGKNYLLLKNYPQARIEFSKLIEQSDAPVEFIAQSHYDIGESYFLEGQFSMALSFYKKIVDHFSESDYLILARLMMEECYVELGDMENAVKVHKELESDERLKSPAVRGRLLQLKERLLKSHRHSKLPWE